MAASSFCAAASTRLICQQPKSFISQGAFTQEASSSQSQFASASAPLWRSSANYVRLPDGIPKFSGKPIVAKHVFQRRAGNLRCDTIEESEAETSLIEEDALLGGSASHYRNDIAKTDCPLEGSKEEGDWFDLDRDLYYWAKAVRPVQWYPGHIARTEKELKEQLKLMDVVIEVRDARIPMSTSYPQMDIWLGNRKRILVLNREDMISAADRNSWATYFAKQGTKVVFSNGRLGMGSMKLSRLAKALAADVNVKRRAKGLLPRPVRAGIVGYPNVGKSSLINRLLKRRMCQAAPRPGVTRELKWVRFGKDLELLDSPGILPMRISDQSAAIKLAICDDIGERSYDATDIAAILVQMLARVPSVGTKGLYSRYKIETDDQSGQTFVHKVALKLFGGDIHQAAFRILMDFRKGKFGWSALERPPRWIS